MRLRNIPGADEVIRNCDWVIKEPADKKGKWNTVFGNENPIHIEVGMGKGQFITEMAKRNPQINYIGIERYTSVLLRAVQKREQLPTEKALPNLLYLCIDASELPEIFAKDEVAKIYLNFSDPWPKSRHEKRRLTYKTFLDTYKQILPKNGEIHFKTDNRGLFEYSLASFSQYGMVLNKVWLDLHASDYEGNVMTEYERKFSEKGQAIYRVEAQFKD